VQGGNYQPEEYETDQRHTTRVALLLDTVATLIDGTT
jgi:hypothetical protein